MYKFVDIVSCFESLEDRNIVTLSKLYDNKEFLQTTISDMILRHLKPESFENKNVLLKPNWVKHSANELDEICLRTNDNFLLALLEIILTYKPKSILIGDAPIQGCNWDKVVTVKLVEAIEKLAEQYNIPVRIKDFRRVIFNPDKNNPVKDRNPLSEYIIFDLGKKSYLEPITTNEKNLFRVTDYNPDRLAESHHPGVHKYCITKELFDADIVISVPKVKSHQKTGITAALKNLVGVNGDKDFLPHHRIGSVNAGGDCYPDKNIFRTLAERILDFANRHQGQNVYWFARKLTSVLWRFSNPKSVHNLGAGWHGNDTTWRMVLDLNLIALYGSVDGTISDIPQRQLFSLCDGIIGGQGDGPLFPEPLELGVVSFTNHSGMNDIVMATLMGFDTRKIAMLNEIDQLIKKDNILMSWNKKPIIRTSLNNFTIKAKASPGWEGYVNIKNK